MHAYMYYEDVPVVDDGYITDIYGSVLFVFKSGTCSQPYYPPIIIGAHILCTMDP